MFFFVDSFPLQARNAKRVFVDKAICNTNELFELYKKELHFPDWFGNNFDAFYDIMSQLNYWVPEEYVGVFHDSLPSLDEQRMSIYLDILNEVDVEWEKFTERAEIRRQYTKKHQENLICGHAWWDETPKIFNVFFHRSDEAFVKGMLSKYSWDYRQCMSFDERGSMMINYVKHYS